MSNAGITFISLVFTFFLSQAIVFEARAGDCSSVRGSILCVHTTYPTNSDVIVGTESVGGSDVITMCVYDGGSWKQVGQQIIGSETVLKVQGSSANETIVVGVTGYYSSECNFTTWTSNFDGATEIYGADGDDNITGTGYDDELYGNGGDDECSGAGGYDYCDCEDSDATCDE